MMGDSCSYQNDRELIRKAMKIKGSFGEGNTKARLLLEGFLPRSQWLED